MEMESLHHDTHTAEAAEPEPSSEPASYKDAQVWKDIEAETGFASYTDYLEFYQNIRPDFVDRMADFKALPKAKKKAASQPSIVIYDLSIQQNSTTTLSLRCHCHSGTELLQALREVHEPTGTNGVRLVLWFYPARPLSQEMIETLVLGLKLDVKFLDDLPDVVRGENDYSTFLTQRRPTPVENYRTHHIRSVSGESIIATVLKSFMSDVVDEVPVVLVMGTPKYHHSKSLLERAVAEGEYKIRSVPRSSLRDNLGFGRTVSGALENEAYSYARIVEQTIQDQHATPTKAFLLLAAMSPLLYVDAYLVIGEFNRLQRVYKIILGANLAGRPTNHLKENDLRDRRLELRRVLKLNADLIGQVFRYLGSAAQLDYSKEPSYVSIRADLRVLIDDARRLEAEIRDFLQDEIGLIAITESRTSIALSKLQINESKRCKCAIRCLCSLALIIHSENM